jgi:hypothetical protein
MSTLNSNLEYQVLLLSKRYDSAYLDNADRFCATLYGNHFSKIMYITVILS